MNGPKSQKRPHGQVRQSQVVTTFGPGAMVDLPTQAVIVGGLETWQGPQRQIHEERLAAKVDAFLGETGTKLFAPPIDAQEPGGPPAITGVGAYLFPEWFVAVHEEHRGDARCRPLVHRHALVEGKYFTREKTKKAVVPVRFVQACPAGHIWDIDWRRFVHPEDRRGCTLPLWLDERGTSGDLADITVRCECGATKPLVVATQMDKIPLGYCNGNRPWLGVAAREKCGGEGAGPQINKFLVRAATNAYFPQILSVISIPDAEATLREAVDRVFEDFLKEVEDIETLKYERKKAKVKAALEGHSDARVFAEIQRRRGAGGPAAAKPIKQVEIETLLSARESIGEDKPDGDFFARALPLASGRTGPMAAIERIVLVHRLREVVAQVGFTRFEAVTPDVDGELSLDVTRAALSRDAGWVPAIENRGEGVFFALKADAIKAWRQKKPVAERERRLFEGFQKWLERNPSSKVVFPGTPYLMLHSLAHLLITAVSLECGYAASSIRERIYAGEAGYGILLLTGTSDSEGTLGGLVDVGRRSERHLRSALDLGRLCSNDPVCAQHDPARVEEDRLLHGAACHGCLLIAETCCERRNEHLDRALVVRTVDSPGTEFFTDDSV